LREGLTAIISEIKSAGPRYSQTEQGRERRGYEKTLDALGRSASVPGKIAEAAFADFQRKLQTAFGLLILRPTWASTYGFSRLRPEIEVTG
jgi:hypothetical protein